MFKKINKSYLRLKNNNHYTYDYITRSIHGKYPAGSYCKVWFNSGFAFLKFKDNKVIRLIKKKWYFPNIDPTPFDLQIFDTLAEEIRKEIDDEIFSELLKY